MSTFRPDGTLDPSGGTIVFATGKKGSGKSITVMMFFMMFPGDRVVIDIAGDDGPIGPDVVTIEGNASLWGGTAREDYRDATPPPWPEWERKYDSNGRPLPMILRYVPDPGSKSRAADMDLVVGMALRHTDPEVTFGGKPTMLLVHEVGVLAPAGQTRPWTRRALMHNRHHAGLSMGLAGPRSQDIDKLIIQQADLVYVFETKNLGDRKALAEAIGEDVQTFHVAVLSLGPHECLRYDDNEPPPEGDEDDYRLIHMAALPLPIVEQIKAWAEGHR